MQQACDCSEPMEACRVLPPCGPHAQEKAREAASPALTEGPHLPGTSAVMGVWGW